MKTLSAAIATGLVAIPLFAAAQTVNAPGGQVSTDTPIDQTTKSTPSARGVQDDNSLRYGADGSTTSSRPKRSTRPRTASDTPKNDESGIVSDTAVSKGFNGPNTGSTTPPGNVQTFPTKKE